MDGLFDKLEIEKCEPLTNKEKANILKYLDLPKNEEGYYVDAFGKPCSYNGIRTLKRPYTKLPLRQEHLTELERCAGDIFYFVRNYCRIVTPLGVDFPDFRQYQIDFLKTLSKDGDVVASLPRQCVTGDTKIQVERLTVKEIDGVYKIVPDIVEVTVEGEFECHEKLEELLICCNEPYTPLENNNPEFIKSHYYIENIKTDKGLIETSEIHKTIELDVYEIELENGYVLKAAERHVIIDKDYNEIFMVDLRCGQEIITDNGISKVISKKYIGKENCYDITLKEHHLYYTNGILSHNSGKSVTSALYLLHYALFNKNKYVGICANIVGLATEVLDKVKKIFVELPIWMQQGLVAWNKTFIEFENGTRIMTSAANGDAFRGYSINLLLIDECSFIKDWQDFSDSVFPAQEALVDKKKIMISTPNGMNHWYHIVQQAKKEESPFSFFTADWRDVPRFDTKGKKMDPDDFKIEQINKNGRQYFAQNFELAFLGSSNTLIDANALQNLEVKNNDEVIYNSIFYGLRILEQPIKNHNYIIGVDPAKEGIDKTAIQVIDVTGLPFKQVASCNLDDSYLTIPAKLFDLGTYYNNATVVVENNIDNSIVDSLSYNYEYEGEIYKERGKNLLGFRTTTKTKKQMLSLLKKLIEENKLIINDKDTIDEFYVFVQQNNGSFAAQDGYHDDLIMALCMSIVPFLNIRSFDDFRGWIEMIEKRNEEIEKAEDAYISRFLDLGFSTEMNDEDFHRSSFNYEDPDEFNKRFSHGF